MRDSMSANRGAFDQPGSLPLRGQAKLFGFRTSNLPPSKESGQADCGPPNPMEVYERRVVSLKRQSFIQPRLVPARQPYGLAPAGEGAAAFQLITSLP